MKKVIGIIGVVAFAMAMFFNTNVIHNSNGDLDLANLVSLNNANAEYEVGGGGGTVCAVTKNGKVILSCSASSTNCSKSKFGYTISCSNAKLD